MQDKENSIQNEYPKDAYIAVGKFSSTGGAAGKMPVDIGLLAEMRIRVIDHKNENWVAFSEVKETTLKYF